jgi:hypothetical protein
MYAPPEFNRFSQYYELRLYGIGLLPSRPGDMVSVVVTRNVFSHYLVDAALQGGQLAHAGNWSITAAYTAPIAPGIRVGIGLGYTNNPTPVIYTPQTGAPSIYWPTWSPTSKALMVADEVATLDALVGRWEILGGLIAPDGGRMAAPRTSRLKRLVHMWIAAAVVLLVSIGETAAYHSLPLRKESWSFIRIARISSRGSHGAGRSAIN